MKKLLSKFKLIWTIIIHKDINRIALPSDIGDSNFIVETKKTIPVYFRVDVSKQYESYVKFKEDFELDFATSFGKHLYKEGFLKFDENEKIITTSIELIINDLSNN